MMGSDNLRNSKFPAKGRPWSELREHIEEMRSLDTAWTEPTNFKASYNAGPDIHEASWNAYTMYRGDNYLYANLLYPSLNHMADEIVGMALEMLSAPPEGFGTITSGGTESITLAVKSARDWACEHRSIPGTPEIVAPFSAHASLNKAANLTGLRVIRVPVQDFRADVSAMEAAVTENTIMIFGSAPSYPFGCVDPISELSEIAQRHNTWMHVDACVGGFFLPFARDVGQQIPDFDFRVPQVKSISADLHKYGYTARGASLLLLRDESLLEYQTLKFDEWPMGPFNASTVTGSRPGGAVASAWTVMNALGAEGYRELVQTIIDIRDKLIDRLNDIPGVHVCGQPEAGVIGVVGDDGTDMAAVRGLLAERGWRTGSLFEPQGFNILLNKYHGEILNDFTGTLQEVLQLVREGDHSVDQGEDSYGG